MFGFNYLPQEKREIVNGSVSVYGDGKMARQLEEQDIHSPILLVEPYGRSHPLCRSVYKIYPSGMLYKVGFFDPKGNFIHETKMKEYYELQRQLS